MGDHNRKEPYIVIRNFTFWLHKYFTRIGSRKDFTDSQLQDHLNLGGLLPLIKMYMSVHIIP